MSILIRAQRFVKLSDLFEGLPGLSKEWHEANHDDFTFGDCDMSMVTVERFEGSFEDVMNSAVPEDEHDKLDDRLNLIRGQDILIDLEN